MKSELTENPANAYVPCLVQKSRLTWCNTGRKETLFHHHSKERTRMVCNLLVSCWMNCTMEYAWTLSFLLLRRWTEHLEPKTQTRSEEMKHYLYSSSIIVQYKQNQISCSTLERKKERRNKSKLISLIIYYQNSHYSIQQSYPQTQCSAWILW